MVQLFHSLKALFPWERRAIWLLLAVFLGLGALTEYRSAFLTRRMGDLPIFLRTAWAVRQGENIYKIWDHNGWHYLYPPLFAIVMTPLADPGPHTNVVPAIPYAWKVAIWFSLSLIFLALAVHLLASALEESSQRTNDPLPGWKTRRWWALRLIPIWICLPGIGHTLGRGQVNLLLLLLLCGAAAALLRKQSGRAGLWLAGAICLKVIPAFLLILPIWRRDVRCLAACALGLVVGLVLIPVAVFGPMRTLWLYRQWNQVLIQPSLANGTDRSRAKEVTETTATRSQSFVAVLHNTLHPERETRPAQASATVRLTHWSLAGFLTLLTLAVARRRRSDDAAELLIFGALVLLMVLASPVCHNHYFCLAVPLVMTLVWKIWQRTPYLYGTRGWQCLLVSFCLANVLPLFPALQILRDLGLAMYAALALWAAALLLTRPQGKKSLPASLPGASFNKAA